MKIQNSKQKKVLRKLLLEKFGFEGELNYEFFMNNKNKIYLLNRTAAEFPYEQLRVDALGLYFGQLMPGNDIRLSIEGSQIIGPGCNKNVIELDDDQYFLWVRGNELDIDTELTGFVIIKHKNLIGTYDYHCCGKPIVKQENGKKVLLNYVPKARYVRCAD